MDNIGILIISIVGLIIFGVLMWSIKKGIITRAKFWTKLFGAEFEAGENKQNIKMGKNENWIVGPNEGKYDISNGVLRHIPDPETLEALGYDRKKFVRLDAKQFKLKSEGRPIESVKIARLIRQGNTSGVYVVIEGQKRWVPNEKTLSAIKRNFNEVESLSKEEFNKISQGISLVDEAGWSNNS